MYLSEEQIKEITRGAVNISLEDDYYRFYRFSDKQLKVYENTSAGFFSKAKATSGINFNFYTDASKFSFDFTVSNASSRNFYYFDIYVDGVLEKHLGESPMWIRNGHIEINLPEGEHHVTVWFPCLACAAIKNVFLSEDSSLRPVPNKMKMICWGDSITQGYDALFPSLCYANRLAQHFNANMINQAIGGERFCPQILDEDLRFKPDLITVAYGTNDWSGLQRDAFFAGVDGFLEGISRIYTESKIFVITPLWRADKDKITKFGSYYEAVSYIADKAKSLGLNLIDGYNLTPHCFEFYSDLRLHPNDLGYGEYTRNLIPLIEEKL